VPHVLAAISGGQAVLTEDALAEKEAAAKGGDDAAAFVAGGDKRDSAGARRSRRAIEPVSKDQVGAPLHVRCRVAGLR
jgi:hypothetical protein